MDDVARVAEALASGELGTAELTARKLGAFLGGTTSRVYHHHGSLDAFLYAVGVAGFARLGQRLGDPGRPLAALAVAYVDFALDAPALYDLMFHHSYDWAALRARGVTGQGPGLLLWYGLVERIRAGGSAAPAEDARALFAGLHGLASLAISGRANVGDLTQSDREAAHAAARRLVARLTAPELV